MRKKILTAQLNVGMFVELPLSWSQHPFIKSRFKIKDQDQIKKIQGCGLKQVTINTELGDSLTQTPDPDPGLVELFLNDRIPDPKEQDIPIAWSPESLVPANLHEALMDTRMASDQKAKAVYHHSKTMIERLMESPTAENIITSKQVLSSVTDLVLTDDDTANNMLRITSHDFYTYTHSVNVGITALMLAKALFRDSDAHDLHELGAGFFLHDLGKVMVRPEVINKPGKLTDSEMAHMRIHPYQGYKILKEANALSDECKYIVMQHHEYDDGSGYPRHLKGDEIHRYAKICCIADVFDALTSERSYKKAMKPFDALKLMQQQMAAHFDKKLFSEFVLLFK